MFCKAKATCNSPPNIFPSCVMSGYKCHNQALLSLRTESISGTNVTIEINALTTPVGENKVINSEVSKADQLNPIPRQQHKNGVYKTKITGTNKIRVEGLEMPFPSAHILI